ncbi:hypothetical protein DUI87_13536 [Hirundo rustica rustica]|uniref:ribonuclease H n=1 Tax=Hirundo rustica rustica TaxID=333673 RepID=A0A3M0K9A8_HIRRU|nr:hypothetical protein DUI87_13536 [Hirundo rustica rustica]
MEHEGGTRADTNVSASAPTNGDLLSKLAASTRGSAGIDVCTAESVVIDLEKIHKVPQDAFGPLGDGMSAFLMGRSSATIQGIMVHLGLIDADFSGQIQAMVSTPTPSLTIPKGTRIAQLVPFKSSVSRTEDRSRARALSGVRKQFPDAHVYHYMDDILVATPTQDELLRIQPQLLNALHSHGLQVAPEKVQQRPPWKYLGVKILEWTIRHQEVQFVQSVKTVNDAQKLVYRIEPSIDVTVFITTPDLHPTDIIGQWNDDWTDPLHVLESVFLPHQPHKTATALFELIARLIIKRRQRCLQLMGADPSKIILPVQREEFDWSYANNVSLQSALEGFSGQITYHLPSHKLLQVAKNTQFSLRPKIAKSQCKVPPSSLTVRAKQEKPLLPGRMDLSGRFGKP